MNLPYQKNSLLFAPMEGVTDSEYRGVIAKLYPEWDYYFTDFYRVPSNGPIKEQAIVKHFGQKILSQTSLRKKTGFQILAGPKSQTSEVMRIINSLSIDHVDLNLGCPSKKVNAHLGGAYLLKDLNSLQSIVKSLRSQFRGIFTVKIRIGYHDDSLFWPILEILEGEGIDGVTIHGRTRDQGYKGEADWAPIKEAAAGVTIPIIGNGDLWNPWDIQKMFERCNPYAVMIARGALKMPWMAGLYYQYSNPEVLDREFYVAQSQSEIPIYFNELLQSYFDSGRNADQILKRFKSLSRYLFEDFSQQETVTQKLFRAENLHQFFQGLSEVCSIPNRFINLEKITFNSSPSTNPSTYQ